MRKSYGAFKSVDDLLAIRGLGLKRFEKMRKYLTVGKPAAAKPATPSAKSTPPAEKPADKLYKRFSAQNRRGEEAVLASPGMTDGKDA
jgi:hypothetical protein